MHILLLGSGGREHAFAWKIAQSPLCTHLFIAPGNAGTIACGSNVNLSPNDFPAIKKFILDNNIALVVVGPEEPLVNGIYDYFINDEQLKNIPVIGPSKQGAQLEGSKDFSKQFMMRHRIPTAQYRSFTYANVDEGYSFIEQMNEPIVLKADGLAAGKGVIIATSKQEAKDTLKEMIVDAKFGKSSATVVIEEFLKGIEFSVFVLTDGKHYQILPIAKDYKRIGEGDTGLNTGGMGAVTPLPFVNEALMQKVITQIIEPTIKGLQQENIVYKGFIYFGLIKVGDNPFVIEYNCRMGDPETEVVIPMIENDLVPLFLATANQTLHQENIQIKQGSCATIMLVSGGYPGHYEKGYPISGLDKTQNSLVFHAGTATKNNEIVTNGGRVIAVTAYGNTLQKAVQTAKEKASNIHFDYKYYRSDIGFDVL